MGRRTGHLFALLAISSFGSSILAAPVGVFENAVDIGQPPGPGSTVFDGTRYTMRGSGADIWDGGDQFHFAYRRIFGDFQATIRITSRSTLPAGSGSWGRYGLMARWGLETNAKYSLISGVLPTVDAPQAAFGPFYQFRLYNGLNDGNRINYSVDPGTFPANGNKPNWMRLVRHGGTIYGYLAEDANSDGEPDRWCLVGSDSSLSSVPSLLVGVALHSQSGANLGTIVFDNVTFERLPDAIPLTCDEGPIFAQRDFTGGLGSGAKVAAPWSPYTPRVQGGRLNLTREGAFGVGAATWFDFGASTQELAADGFVAEFDAYMSRTGVIFGDVFPDLNPADGLTFAVVERGSEILGACPDRSEPRVARFTSSALPWSGVGCAPAVLTSDIGDLTPSFLSTNSVRSQGDIWSGGDSFLYQYASLTGDFDVAVELRSYAHSTGAGRWGKFGLMVRQTLDTTSRFTMVAAHGPSLEDPARMTGRTVHLDPGDVPIMYESIFPAVGARPRFQRLTRRGNRVQGWVSDNPGLADGSLNAYNDCNWIAGAVDDWGPAAPATLLVGFANSNHNSSGCAEQLIQYRGLPAARPSPVPLSDLVGFGGGSLGYGGGSLRDRTECHPSFAVELDNWVGGGEPGNEPFDGGSPTYDGNYHVGLDVNAEVSSIQTNVDHGVPTSYLPFIFDPANGVHVKVRYEPGGTVTTYIRSNVPPAAEYEVLSERIPPLAGSLLFGFTVGTGAATATHEIDNLVVRRIACTEQPRSAKKPVLIDLGNVTGGGDGSRHSLAPYAGVDQRNGTFVTAGFDGRINDNDGNYIAAGPAPFIDSVFFIEPRLPGRDPPQAITQSGVAYFFGPTDSTRSSWNFILKDRTGGISAPGINVGGITDFSTSVGLHAAMGITYDLDALRATHGAENVQCFSTVWGLDNCATGDVNLYALLSQESGIISQRSFHATAGFWEVLQLPIPSGAKYLTLATGSNGNDNCDHATFARAIVTGLPCPSYSSFTFIWEVSPDLVNTNGGDNVAFFGESLAPADTLYVGGMQLLNQRFVSPTFMFGEMPALAPGCYDAAVYNSDSNLTAWLPNAVEVALALEIESVVPREVFRDAETPVTVHGANFRPQTEVFVYVDPNGDGFPLLDPVFVDSSTITGRVPALPAGEPNGFRKVTVTDSRGTAELAQGVEYVDASGIRLAGVSPSLVSTLGGTRVAFTGAGFVDGLVIPRIGGKALTNVDFVSSTRLEGDSPSLAAGLHAADLQRSTGGTLVTLPNAVEAVPPVILTSLSPRNVFRDGTTQVTVNGQNFRPATHIQIGGRNLVSPVVVANGLTITGIAPALNAGEALGARDVVAFDPRGDVTLPAGANYINPPAVTITGVGPAVVAIAGGTLVTFTGNGFRQEAHTPRLGGLPLSNVTFVSAFEIRGRSPALAAGFHDADITGPGGAVLATRARAVEAAAPPTLTGVDPRLVLSTGGTSIVVRGTGFRAVTRIQIGTRDLLEPVLAGDGNSITGRAPALGAQEALGPRDVTARDPRGDVSLPGGVTYIAPPPAAPGPQEIESSLAEGTARFRWANPVAYTKILVTDTDDNLLAELPGNSHYLELPAFGRDRFDVRFIGIVGEDMAAPSDASAMRHECERPAPLMWGGTPGDLNLTLYGAHPSANPVRCVAPAGLGPAAEPDGAGGGEGAAAGEPGAGGAILGKLGWVVQQEFFTSAIVQKPTQLVTGFLLEQPADKLEIAGYYEKLATAFDLELRVRLKHVYPDDGFEDEFTLPDVLLEQGKALNCITYFRADKDIGHAGVASDPDPAKQPPKSCQLQIPEGEYLLTFYAVGGSAQLPYYVFSDDPHDNELLIAGAPCPPYPLARVTDLTGLRTLPDITEIRVTEESYRIAICKDPGKIFRVLNALGVWLDELNDEHDVQTDSSPHFEYIWTVHDRGTGRTISTANRPRLNYCFVDWGCYKIDLKIRDLQCGFEKTRSFEVPIVPGPSETICPAPFTFLYPTPDPMGLYAVVGLKAPNAPTGQGTFNGTRKIESRVLVVPQCYCADSDPTDCPGALLGPNPDSDTDDDVQFRMACAPSPGQRVKVEGAKIRVKDLCPNVTFGAKYFLVEVDDLGALPPIAGLPPLNFCDVFLQGRKRPPGNDPNVGWRDVGESAARPMHLGNRPESLNGTFWSGHFIEGDESYHFVSRASRNPQAAVPIGPSNAIELPLPGTSVGIPSFNNDLAAGFSARYAMMSGVWFAEEGSGASSGQVMGNAMSGAPVQVKPAGGSGGGTGGGFGDGEGGALPKYEWCDHRSIVDEHFSQTLFESILYTGFIGPIPVTIFASIGFGLDIAVDAYTTVKVTPFQALLDGGSFAETHFYLLSTTNLAIPCELRADVVGGIVSIAMRLIPSAEFRLDTHIWSRDVDAHADLFVKATLDLAMQVEGCLNLVLTKLCVAVTIPILEDEPLMDPIGTDPRPPVTCSGGGGGELADAPEDGGTGGGIIKFDLPYQSISAPVSIASPDRKSRMEITFDQAGISKILVNSDVAETPTFSLTVGDLLNPAAAFVSNTGALIAWTKTYCPDSGLGAFCDPEEGDPPATLAQQNLMDAQQDIVISRVTKTKPTLPGEFPKWIVAEPIRIADPIAEEPVPANRRADGMAAIAADLSALSDDPPGGEAIVAWVRYLGDYIVADGTKTIYVNPCANDDPPKACDFVAQSVPNLRPQMELTAIYARRVGLGGLVAAEEKVQLSPPGINIEPTITLSPSGNKGYCVWVHDPTHKNLLDTNLGRRLLYSVYSGATNTWSASASVLPALADYDAKYPGVLEPRMVLKDDQTGLLVFTALGKSAPARDSGLAGSRFVYGVRLVGGVFDEPFLIHGKCLRRQYGWIPQIVYDIPDLIDPFSRLHIPQPDWVMVFQGTGPIGELEGAGNVMVSVLPQGATEPAPPVALMNDGQIYSNVTASLAGGVLHTLSLNSGPALISLGLGAGGGVATRQRFFQSVETRLEPDLAIIDCQISDPFPAPGSRVKARVTVENQGLAGSPVDDLGKTGVGVEAVFVRDDGSERVAATGDVEPILPGETTIVTLDLEMPHDPVRVRVRLSPNPIDRSDANNSKECLFGAPAPGLLACERIAVGDVAETPAVDLSWTNAAVYDEIVIFRDGSMLASLPGGCQHYVDLYAPEETVEYAVRGRMGASKSVRTTIICPGESREPHFRRGDTDSNQQMQITDAIALLGFLFLGSAEPRCQDAADADDNGQVQITDAIRILGYLFLGGGPPAAPFPECGEDPTPDALPCSSQPGCP